MTKAERSNNISAQHHFKLLVWRFPRRTEKCQHRSVAHEDIYLPPSGDHGIDHVLCRFYAGRIGGDAEQLNVVTRPFPLGCNDCVAICLTAARPRDPGSMPDKLLDNCP